MATGGFESNLDWLREVWGDAADNFIIRGTPYNTGTLLRLMLDAGAQSVGDARECHAVAVDARAPKFDGGIVTRLDCLSLGIVVNQHAERFYDEGEDFWPKRYAIWGTLVAQAAGSDRVLDRRCQGGRPIHAVGVSAEGGELHQGARDAAESAAREAGGDRRRLQSGRAPRNVRPRGPRRLPDRRPEPREDALGAARSTRRRSGDTRSAPGSRSPILD